MSGLFPKLLKKPILAAILVPCGNGVLTVVLRGVGLSEVRFNSTFTGLLDETESVVKSFSGDNELTWGFSFCCTLLFSFISTDFKGNLFVASELVVFPFSLPLRSTGFCDLDIFLSTGSFDSDEAGIFALVSGLVFDVSRILNLLWFAFFSVLGGKSGSFVVEFFFFFVFFSSTTDWLGFGLILLVVIVDFDLLPPLPLSGFQPNLLKIDCRRLELGVLDVCGLDEPSSDAAFSDGALRLLFKRLNMDRFIEINDLRRLRVFGDALAGELFTVDEDCANFFSGSRGVSCSGTDWLNSWTFGLSGIG